MGNNQEKLKIEEIPADTMEKYFAIESDWIDKQFELNWPKAYSFFAKKMNNKIKKGKSLNFIEKFLVFIFARLSRMTIQRNKHLKMLGGKGFRPGYEKTILDSVTVTILKGKKEVAKNNFKLSFYDTRN